MKLLALGASALLTSTLWLAPAPASSGQPSSDPASDRSSGPAARSAQGTYQKQILRVTNKKRVRHDRVELRQQRCVQKYAVRQARKMARQERMHHQDLGPVLRDCGLRAVGENVAAGFPTGRAAVQGWMRSEGHRGNILNPTYRLLGSGARRSDDGTWYAAQVFGRK